MDSRDLRSIKEAYNNIHNSQEQLDEGAGIVTGAAKVINAVMKSPNQTPKQKEKAVRDLTKAMDVVAKPIKSVLSVGDKKNEAMKNKRMPSGARMEDVDLFDIIKGHLLDEGYVDTEEAALAIMANMSEEWKQSIVEGVGGYDDPVLGPHTPGGKAVRKSGKMIKGAIQRYQKSGAKGINRFGDAIDASQKEFQK